MKKVLLFCLTCSILAACASLPSQTSFTPIPTSAGGQPPAKPTQPPSGGESALQKGVPEAVRTLLSQGEGGYVLLQFNGPVDDNTLALLQKAGIVLYDPQTGHAYYAYLPGGSLPILEQLVKEDILYGVTMISNADKLQPQLAEKISSDPQASYEVVVQFFKELSPDEKSQLEALVDVRDYSFGPVNIAEGAIPGQDVEKLLALPFVKWVEERSPADVNQGG